MKKYFFAVLFFVMSGNLCADSVIWDRKNNFDGWKVFYNTKGKLENDVIKLYNIRFDPYIINKKVDIDPEKYDTLTYTYRASGKVTQGQFYFNHTGERFSDRRKWNLPPMIADGQWHTIKVKAADLTSWKKGGKIIELRLDPTDSAGGSIEISEIRLEKSAVPKVLKFDKSNKFGSAVTFRRCHGNVTADFIKLDNLQSDCGIYFSNLDIDTSKYDRLKFTYRANGVGTRPGQFYFTANKTSLSDKNSWRIPALVSDGKWHTMVITPQNLSSWIEMKRVNQLRLDPTDSAGGSIEISEVCLENSGNAGKIAWNKINNFAGWKFFRNCKGKVENGVLKLTDIKADPGITVNELNIKAADFNAMLVSYRATGMGNAAGQLYFAPPKSAFVSNRYWHLAPPVSDGQWHTAVLTSHDLAKWLECKTIGRFRYDPTDSAGGTMEISEISLVKLTDDEIKKMSSAKIKGNYNAPLWPTVKSQLWPDRRSIPETPEHYFAGSMIRSPEDVLVGRRYQEFYLRKTFNLKAKPAYGFLQYTADDCAEAFVNGKKAGYSSTWKTGICVDVTDSLQAGKNVLAFHYLNPETYGGVLCELYVQYGDGSFERINSDKSYKSATAEEKDWKLSSFNDSHWSNAVEQSAPPAAPWKVVIPYRFYQNMQKLVSAEIVPKVVPAGTVAKLNFLFNGVMPDESLAADIVLKNKNNQILWRENVLLDKKYFKKLSAGKWLLEYPYKVPYYLSSNDINISVETKSFVVQTASAPSFKFRLEQLKKDATVPGEINFRVARNGNQTYFEFNGKPFFPMWISSGLNISDPDVVNLCTVGVPREYHVRIGELNFTELDRAAETAYRKHPNAYFMWDLKVYVPRDFAERFPQDMCLDEDGNININGWENHSHASVRAYKELEDYVVRTIEYLEKSPYANRIVGYRVTGGVTIEWLGWESVKNKALDFAPAAQKAFAEFARKKYPMLKDVSVPRQKERLARDGKNLLWDQKKNMRSIAYNNFTSEITLDFMVRLARKARSMVGKNKVIGSYYGYVSTLHYTGKSQVRAHYATKKLLDAEVLDFIMSPQSYALRNMGETCGEMKPSASMKAHNMVTVIENDTRTHYSFPSYISCGEFQTVNEKQTVDQVVRNFAIDICRSQPAFFITQLHNGEFDYPVMFNTLKHLRKLGSASLEDKAVRYAEIALVVSEESIKSMPVIKEIADSGIIDQKYAKNGTVTCVPRRRQVLNYETFIGNQSRFNRSGALVDQLLAEDLADNPGNYKLYVFLNCYKYDEKFMQAVRKLQEKKCVLLWLYAPGYIKGQESSTANMKALTGIGFELITKPTSSAAEFADKRIMGTPNAEVVPLFAVKDPAAEVLARYSNGKAAVAVKKTGKAVSVFSGAWQLDMKFVRDMLKLAGVYRYITTDDPFDACSNTAVLHARFPGRKTIMLPRKATVIDVMNKKLIGRNIDRFESDFYLHQSKCFYFGRDAEKILEELKKIK
ncbi:MAG: hypothetical protein IKA22_05650 [Lentisphaeria bacterium]|nr:hypothetical protein [Lentisphaeria bacterium]